MESLPNRMATMVDDHPETRPVTPAVIGTVIASIETAAMADEAPTVLTL
jgi:hypothetical protein